MGVLIGLLTIPLGCLAGGAAMSLSVYSLSIGRILQNLLPVLILDGLIIAGLLFFPIKTLRIFVLFGSFITKLIIVLLGIAVAQYLTGIRLPIFYRMVEPDAISGIVPLTDGFAVVGSIAMVLLGAFPMIHFITNKFGKYILKYCCKQGLNE